MKTRDLTYAPLLLVTILLGACSGDTGASHPAPMPEPQPADRSAAAARPPEAVRTEARSRGRELASAIAELRRLAGEAPPAGLSPGQLADWSRQTDWLKLSANRLREHGAGLEGLLENPRTAEGVDESRRGAATAAGSMADEMAAWNEELESLQEEIRAESRRYQTLSNAARSRHEAAMAAIRNTRP